jgi:hypothetical protein
MISLLDTWREEERSGRERHTHRMLKVDGEGEGRKLEGSGVPGGWGLVTGRKVGKGKGGVGR